jgi:hypothetical protein
MTVGALARCHGIVDADGHHFGLYRTGSDSDRMAHGGAAVVSVLLLRHNKAGGHPASGDPG